MKKLILSILFAGTFAGCFEVTGPGVSIPENSGSGNIIYMWIAPITDTKIDADAPDMNFYKSGDNTFARAHIPGTMAWYVKSFIKIQLPRLPQGSKVDEAYFEMFHSGTTEDGTTDNTSFLVSPVGVQWRADTITWNHSPDRGMPSVGVNPYRARLHSNDWSGTENISSLVQDWFDDSTHNTGFRVEVGDQQNFYKSFYSNNSYIGSHNSDGRTDSTLGKAPRLLIKVELPAGKTMADIVWNTILPDFDITLGSYFKRTGKVKQGIFIAGVADFPTEWGAKKGQ